MSRETSGRRIPIRNDLFSIGNRILLTGFEPFGGARVNPSQRVAEALAGTVISGRRVQSLILPCRFGEGFAVLQKALRGKNYDLVICLGLAEKRRAITPERMARNRMDARIPDNAGRHPRRQPVRLGGPATLQSGLSVAGIAAALRAAGLPARVSRSAGRFVCNELFYRLLDSPPVRAGLRAGFIHVPALRVGSRKRSGLSLAAMVRAVRIAIAVAVAGDG
jgi:pyroglutamyl-peptidase